MAGANITYTLTTQDTLAALQAAADALGSPRPLLRDIGEALLHSTQDRFSSQTDPEGNAWEPLSPRYQRRKKYNANKILTLHGYLRSMLVFQESDQDVVVGSNLPYAARMHFGGEFEMAARSQYAYFRRGKNGDIGRLFVKKEKSNFKQGITIGAHKVVTPARPFLGVSLADEQTILDIAQDHLDRISRSRSAGGP